MNLTNQILYADILECKRKKGRRYYEDENAILIESPSSRILYLAAYTETAAKQAIHHLPTDFAILVTHEMLGDAYLQKTRDLLCGLRCYHSAYQKEIPPLVCLPDGYHMEVLQAKHIEEIITLYKHSMPSLATPEYIQECLEDEMFGVFEKEILCGFIGVHAQESIGLLEVKEPHRRKGLAILLLRQMVASQMQKGRIPYGEIVEDNQNSILLQKKAGLQVDAHLTYWYFNDERI